MNDAKSKAHRNCYVCGANARETGVANGHSTKLTCDRCGQYNISSTCIAILGDPHKANCLLNTDEKKAAVGHWLRTRGGDEAPQLSAEVAERLAKQPWFPSLVDQRENVLRFIGTMTGAPGEDVQINSGRDQYIFGCPKQGSILAIVEQLSHEGLVEFNNTPMLSGVHHMIASLTFRGWIEFENLQRGRTSGRTAFMAMPFNRPDLDDVWLPALRLAVKETGFELKRVDDEPKPGLIDVRMRLQIKQARFLIVELTHANSGAYWEAGFAEVLGKPVIYTIKSGDKAHFDVDHSLRITWSPDTIESALQLMKATIRNELPDATQEIE